MIYFDDLPLDKEILDALGELSINYVFQPIFQADGKTIFAREALMRPTDKTVTELIEEYTKKDKLHVLEIATDIYRIPEKQENVKNLVLEFHSRGMLVVAEGIEKKEEFEYLIGLGVDLYQGYYLARPS